MIILTYKVSLSRLLKRVTHLVSTNTQKTII
nr:hypothetical protein CoNPh38_CDS0315 [Staphylococcus phage S-CoN_Ph38]